MHDVIVVSGSVLVVATLLGLPLAFLVRTGGGRVALLADALLLGVPALALAPALVDWFGWPALVLILVGVATAAVAAGCRLRSNAARAGAGDTTPEQVRAPWWTRLARLRAADWALASAWAIVAGVAVTLRLRETNFVLWIGDMGAYVNWANEFARTGTLDTGWPPLFPAYLSLASAVFGPGAVTAGVPALGIVLLVALARLLHELHAPAWLVVAGVGAAAVNPHAVWYSTFPASESMAGGLLLTWGLFVHRAVRDRAPAPAVAAAGIAVAMCLLRGNAMVYAAVAGVVALLSLVVPAWRRAARPWAWATGGAAAGVAAAHWYGVGQIRVYYVDLQLPEFVPSRAMDLLDRLGLLDPGIGTALLMVAGPILLGVVLTALARLAERHAPPETDRRTGVLPWLALGGLSLVAAVLVLVAARGGYDVWDILNRTGVVYAAGFVAGIAVAPLLRDRADQTLLLTLGAVAVIFLAVQIPRLGGSRVHLFHLYWDRYLVSEVIPVALVITFVGLGVVATGATRMLASRRPTARIAPWVTPVGSVTVAVAIAIAAWPAVRLATGGEFMRGAEALVEDLAEVADEDTPVYWSADGDGTIDDWHYSNTWTAFALPLEWTYGRELVNTHRPSGADPDEVLTAAEAIEQTACAYDGRLTVFEAARGGRPLDERLAGSGLNVEHVANVAGTVEMLSQGVGTGWYEVDFEITAWLVQAPADASSTCSRD